MLRGDVPVLVNQGSTNRSVVLLENESRVFGFAPKAMITPADWFVSEPHQRI